MAQIDTVLKTYQSNFDTDKINIEVQKIFNLKYQSEDTSEYIKLCLSCLDYTKLTSSDTNLNVRKFVSDLLNIQIQNNFQVAGVCVYPNFINIVNKTLGNNTNIKRVCVCGNFPSSQTFSEVKHLECQMAIKNGATEIDVVVNIGDVFEGNYQKVYDELRAIRKTCKEVKLKVILETGELQDPQLITNTAITAMYAGCDFIKTSTGKSKISATPTAAYIMCQAIKQYQAKTGNIVGIKIAGGVSSTENALRYVCIIKEILGKPWLTPSHFRIGSSSLLEKLLKDL